MLVPISLVSLLLTVVLVVHREVTMKNDDEEDPCLRCLRFASAKMGDDYDEVAPG